MHLLDLLSAGAPGWQERSMARVEWIDVRSREIFLSAMTAAEISNGIAKSRRNKSASRAGGLRDWLELAFLPYGDRLPPFDVPAARPAREMIDGACAAGRAPGFAAGRALIILTRNLRRFAPPGAKAVNPFDTPPIDRVLSAKDFAPCGIFEYISIRCEA